jgi:cytoplasmic FMR1 interacting protein
MSLKFFCTDYFHALSVQHGACCCTNNGGLKIIKKKKIAISKETKRTDDEYKSLYNLALNGLQLLSKWTNTVLELYNWKLLNLTDHKSNPSCPKDAEEYERATKYNYNSQEKIALIEIISMIKGLQALMYRLENAFKEAVNLSTYNELQRFVQIDIRDMIRKAASKKKDIAKTVFLAVRDTCVDWYRGKEPSDDPAMKGKKDPESGFKIDRPPRFIGPSSTQLYMVRTMLESLICDRSKGKKTLRKDIDTKHLEAIESFHTGSFFWSYLLNFTGNCFFFFL